MVETPAGDALSGVRPATSPDADPVEDSDGTVRMALLAEHASVTRARRYVQRRWPDLDEEVLDDVSLIVSELVSNAVVHGRPAIEMRMRVVPFAVDVAVLEHNPALPAPLPEAPEPTSASGRGLLLVDRLSHRWGVEPFADGTGKTVWAHVEGPQEARSDQAGPR